METPGGAGVFVVVVYLFVCFVEVKGEEKVKVSMEKTKN